MKPFHVRCYRAMFPLGAMMIALALSACAVSKPPAPKIKPDAPRPNILFIFTDDHAWQAVSAYDPSRVSTPSIDLIAKQGIRFTNCYVPNSICGPSRAAILTGLYSHENGFYRNGNEFNGAQWTFPQALQRAGYDTALIGKWHLGEHMAPVGFNYSNVLIGQGPYYNPKMMLDENGDGERTEIQLTGYTTDLITDMTIEWLDNRPDKSKPFMLMTQHKAPHRPWEPALRHLTLYDDMEMPEPPTLFDDYAGRPRAARLNDMQISDTMTDRDLKLAPVPYLNDEQRAAWDAVYGPKNEEFRRANLTGKDLVRWKYQRYVKDYMRCVTAVDENIGRLLNYLEKEDLTENTLVIYCSDQGFFLGEHGWFDKRWMYEESFKTPLVMRWPAVIQPGRVSDDIVSVVDFAQTFCDLAGMPAAPGRQGRSLTSLLTGPAPADWRQYFYYHYYEYPGWHAVRKHYGVADGRYKLIHFYETDMNVWHLVDLKADPLELKNFYDDPNYADVQKRMHEALEEQRRILNVTEEDPPESYPPGNPYL